MIRRAPLSGEESSHSRHSLTIYCSGKYPYSSFSRSQWDRNRDRGKEKSIPEDVWEHDPLASILTSRVERIIEAFPFLNFKKNWRGYTK